MSTRAQLAIAAAIALLSAVGIGFVVVHWISRDARVSAPFGLHETGAVAPFVGYRAVRISAGDRCLRVVVADTPARSERGLRGVNRFGPYSGMLFVESRDSSVAFTMAGVKSPLDITWYGSDGRRIDGVHMVPCPNDAARCPVYRSSRPYRVALETAVETPSADHLSPCS